MNTSPAGDLGLTLQVNDPIVAAVILDQDWWGSYRERLEAEMGQSEAVRAHAVEKLKAGT